MLPKRSPNDVKTINRNEEEQSRSLVDVRKIGHQRPLSQEATVFLKRSIAYYTSSKNDYRDWRFSRFAWSNGKPITTLSTLNERRRIGRD